MINKFGNAIVLYVNRRPGYRTHTPVITGQRCGRVWITLIYTIARARVCIQNTKYILIIIIVCDKKYVGLKTTVFTTIRCCTRE